MRIMSMKFTSLFSLLALLFIGTAFAQAGTTTQVGNSTAQSVSLSSSVSESLTVSVSPTSLVIPNSGASAPITATVSYALIPANHTGVSCPGTSCSGIFSDVWFATTTALTGPVSIPSSNVEIASATFGGTVSAASASNVVCNSTPVASTNYMTQAAITGMGLPNVSSSCIALSFGSRVSQGSLQTTPSGTLTDTYTLQYVTPLTVPGSYSGTVYINYIAE